MVVLSDVKRKNQNLMETTTKIGGENLNFNVNVLSLLLFLGATRLRNATLMQGVECAQMCVCVWISLMWKSVADGRGSDTGEIWSWSTNQPKSAEWVRETCPFVFFPLKSMGHGWEGLKPWLMAWETLCATLGSRELAPNIMGPLCSGSDIWKLNIWRASIYLALS